MKRETFPIEIITPCFCAGADQSKAEIRPASIRGQLRWWFRVLGGFKSMNPLSVAEQEALIFGSTAGDDGVAGQLTVRVRDKGLQSTVRDGQELGHPNFSPSAFLTFPIQSREKDGRITTHAGRGTILSGTFELQAIWRGNPRQFADIILLIHIFANLGSLGFRGRRAMGAISPASPAVSLSECFASFNKPGAIIVKSLPAKSSKDAISVLGGWLKSCRAHGRSGKNKIEMQSPYFGYAKRDHDIGYGLAGNAKAFRPALGLPIIQRTSKTTNNWEWNYQNERAEGRFASPVILRPHKDANGKWHALVIFVDAKQWPVGKQVYLNGKPRSVSLDLYNAMKADSKLQPFP